MVLDGKAELIENAAYPCGAQCVRPHQGAELRCADLDGDAEQGDAGSSDMRPPLMKRRVGKAKRAHHSGNDWIRVGRRKRAFAHPTNCALMFRYALKYAICVVVASNRPDGDHNSPLWSP